MEVQHWLVDGTIMHYNKVNLFHLVNKSGSEAEHGLGSEWNSELFIGGCKCIY